MSILRVGFSRCIRCEFTTEGVDSFDAQDKAMDAHLAEKHPGWMTDGFKSGRITVDLTAPPEQKGAEFERESIERVSMTLDLADDFMRECVESEGSDDGEVNAVKLAVGECSQRLKLEAEIEHETEMKVSAQLAISARDRAIVELEAQIVEMEGLLQKVRIHITHCSCAQLVDEFLARRAK